MHQRALLKLAFMLTIASATLVARRSFAAEPTTRPAAALASTRTLSLPGTVQRAAFSPDGKRLAVACDDATVLVFNAATGAITHKLTAHRDECRRLKFSDDGRTLFSFGVQRLFMTTGGADAWRLDDGPPPAFDPTTQGRLFDADLSDDGSTLLLDLDLIDLAAGKKTTLTLPGKRTFPPFARFLPDGKRIAVFEVLMADNDVPLVDEPDTWRLSIVSRANGTRLKSFPLRYTELGFGPHDLILNVVRTDHGYRCRDLFADKDLPEIETGTEGIDLSFSHDLTRLVTSTTKRLRVWDPRAGTMTAEYHAPDGDEIRTAAPSPDGRIIAVGIGKRLDLLEPTKP